MNKIILRNSYHFLHPDLGKGDVLELKWERQGNYGTPLFTYSSKVGDQPLDDYELARILEDNMKYELPLEPELKASSKQVSGDHYKKLKIQPMEYCLANNLNYGQANAIKYITRYLDKNGKQDLEKAIHCIQLLMEYEYEGE